MKLVTYITQSIRFFTKANKRALGVVRCRAACTSDHPNNIRRRVLTALVLRSRGAVRNDVLAIKRLAVSLHLEWFARECR
jgi:hypothetical protein